MNVEKKRGLRKQMISNPESMLKLLIGALFILTGFAFAETQFSHMFVVFTLVGVMLLYLASIEWRK
jgi:VIT1/CCC1 family predicted Fe2+/Mn2+ transporter